MDNCAISYLKITKEVIPALDTLKLDPNPIVVLDINISNTQDKINALVVLSRNFGTGGPK